MMLLIGCGGGDVAGGAGGSGVGGTGIFARVQGNVATVNAHAEPGEPARVLLAVRDLLMQAAIAQSGNVAGIQVNGGGQVTSTDAQGRFVLNNVAPNNSFVLTLTLQDGQQVSFNIGPVPAGSTVIVANIVVNANQGTAAPSNVTVQQPSNPPSGSSGSGDDDDDDGGNDDGGDDDDDDDDGGDDDDDDGDDDDDNGDDGDDDEG